MKTSKKTLAILMALAMTLALMVPALASGNTPSTTDNGKVQITKTLKIGRGITVPTETFNFTFTPALSTEVAALGDASIYIDPDLSQQSVTYPALDPVSVSYNAALRGDGASDDALTYLTPEIDLTQKTWPVAGLYIYAVKETDNGTAGMTYDNQTYYLKVYVTNNASGGTDVNAVTVMGQNENGEWVKRDGAPTDAKETVNETVTDGVDDMRGNEFRFTNAYTKLVDKHPTNPNTTSGDTELSTASGFSAAAFKLTKDVSGSYASTNDAFDFVVTMILPDTYSGPAPVANVNGYSAHNFDDTIAQTAAPVDVTLPTDGRDMSIALRHGDSFSIAELPAGTLIQVTENAFAEKAYAPSYSGKWGLDTSDANIKTDHASKSHALQSSTIVVGENGAYIQYTNTINDADVTATGIVINNLPYILMIVIAVAGIGFYMVSRKRRA